MTKQAFFTELKARLSGLPAAEANERFSFYDEMIKNVSDCKSDLEVMKVFKVKTEIQSELTAYLEKNGVSSQMIKMVVESLFEYIKDI